MMDREMLEMAARAAGYVVESHHVSGGAWVYPVGEALDADSDYPGLFLWRPREDDGDALRLAVKLGLHITQYPIYDEPKHSAIAKKSARLLDDTCVDTCVGIEVYDSDPYAATRLAIFRAAAEIGKQMEETK